ncbi:MAG: His/Gly/Thr/Pro-type tRNA ligase C-terminal domain-containing protein, partial [Candidatus Enteromonas sp.]|nr:His/Gly/Thr/Pro-type tRNA ligase C-terminal domain-containing protein [Candidatus Enteromonas sp.]
GVNSARFDAECICLAMQVLGMLGFKGLHLKINSLGDEASRKAYRDALKAYFAEHIDDMCADCHERLELNPMRILDCKVEHDQEIAKGAPKMKDYLSEESEKRFYQTLSILNDMDIEYEIDDSLVRGLDYYGEVVFEVHAISKTGADYGALRGGGHYDGLLEALGGPQMAGVGFAFGLERIYNVMKDDGLLDDLEEGLDIYVMPVGESVLDESFELVSAIRNMGYTCDSPLAAIKLGSQFKKAAKKKAHYALIVGEEELQRGVAQLKDLEKQEQKEISLENLEEELDSLFGEDEHEHHHHEE